MKLFLLHGLQSVSGNNRLSSRMRMPITFFIETCRGYNSSASPTINWRLSVSWRKPWNDSRRAYSRSRGLSGHHDGLFWSVTLGFVAAPLNPGLDSRSPSGCNRAT